jgi:preprotein translocase subunit SecG
MMYQFILLIHVFVAVFVIALVLVQQGKGATMGAAFGSGASQTVFGSRGSGSFLFRVTISLAIIFFVTSIGLNYLATYAYKQAQVGNVTLPALPMAPLPIKKTPAPDNATTGQIPGEIPERK